jgi:hypothetical protein
MGVVSYGVKITVSEFKEQAENNFRFFKTNGG